MTLKLGDEILQAILVQESYVSAEDMNKAVDFAQKNIFRNKNRHSGFNSLILADIQN